MRHHLVFFAAVYLTFLLALFPETKIKEAAQMGLIRSWRRALM
jgi:hypothetical protein